MKGHDIGNGMTVGLPLSDSENTALNNMREKFQSALGRPTLPELIADREAIHAAQKEDLKRKTVKVRKSLLP